MKKTKISITEFNKKIEIEAAHLIYFEYMNEVKAYSKARESISKYYEV